ncbi:hypothetical protein BJV74DRAFT_799394 [Russula compacta]|nr:hypothetical protein BJV74DRAFT_799394 [Russula compacta]
MQLRDLLVLVQLESGSSVPVESPKKKYEKFNIPFEVPFKNATRDLEGITSFTTFDDFLDMLSKKMETQKSLLSSIGYMPSYKPKSPKPVPKLLEDEASWNRLVADGKAETSDNKQPALPFTADQLKEQELQQQLEKRHYCQQHKKACFVESDGNHYHYTPGDLATWAMLLAKQKATIDDALEALKLTDKAPRQRAIKTTAVAAPVQSDNNANPLPWLPQMMAGMFAPWAMMQAAGGAAFGGYPGPAQVAFNPNAPPPHADQGIPSPKQPAEIEYPDIIPWLASLDADPVCGKKQLNFVQYGDVLSRNGILNLSDVLSLTPEKLQELGRMAFGIANQLIGYAKDDDKDLQGRAKRAWSV